MTAIQKAVTPVKTGVQTFCKCFKNLDSGFRRNDEKTCYWTFCKWIKVEPWIYVIEAQQNLAECSRRKT